jgi:monoamine oxidase
VGSEVDREFGPRVSRRRFLAGAGALGAATLVSGPLAVLPGRADASRRRRVVRSADVVVVGAGLAGLACAHRLHQRGVSVAVYEARPDRVGGRCWTARGFADGQVAEHGGEFIDSDHARIRALVA